MRLLCDVPQAKPAAFFGDEPIEGGYILRVAVFGQFHDDCADFGSGGRYHHLLQCVRAHLVGLSQGQAVACANR